jgi:hypothetical protein
MEMHCVTLRLYNNFYARLDFKRTMFSFVAFGMLPYKSPSVRLVLVLYLAIFNSRSLTPTATARR